MIAIVLALDTEQTARCLDYARTALTQGGVPVDTVHADTVDQLTERLLGGTETRTIAVLHRIDAPLAGILAGLERPTILLHTDPILAVLSARREPPGAPAQEGQSAEGQSAEGQDLVTQDLATPDPAVPDLGTQVRDVMRRLSTFVTPQARPLCTTLDADADDTPRRLLDLLLDHLEAREAWRDQSLDPAAARHPPALPAEQLNEDGLMLKGALAGFTTMRDGSAPRRVVVSRRLFQDATAAGAPVAGPIDVTGRRQLLVYGPYIHLPPGNWQARLVLEFSAEVRDVPFLVDVATQRGADIRARTSFTVDQPGRREIVFGFLHERPNVPIEFRIFSERAIFDGEMALGFADLRRAEGFGERQEELEGDGESQRQPSPA